MDPGLTSSVRAIDERGIRPLALISSKICCLKEDNSRSAGRNTGPYPPESNVVIELILLLNASFNISSPFELYSLIFQEIVEFFHIFQL